jgi:hypothetical protein
MQSVNVSAASEQPSPAQRLAATRSRLIVVLGMHRSGTSAITRGLQTLGVELGERLMPAVDGNNAKGFWEDLDFNALNIELMRALGGEWDTLSPLDITRLPEDQLTAFRLRAAALLRERMADGVVYGIKDPRMARLLGFWKPVFAHLDIDTAYLIALRHPLSIASSLAKRDGFSLAKSSYLWLLHVVPAIEQTHGARRVVVDFDRLMDQPRTELERIAKALDLPADLSPQAYREYVRDFLEESLRHTVHEPEDLGLAAGLPSEVGDAYFPLLDAARDDVSLESDTVKRSFSVLHEALARLTPLFDEVSMRGGALASHTADAEQLQGKLEQRDGENAALIAGMESLKAKMLEMQDAARRREQENAELTAGMASLQDHNTALAANIAGLQTASEAREQENAALAAKLHDLHARLDASQVREQHIEQEAAALRQTLDASRETIRQLHRSTSWRLTAGLRAVKAWTRGR